MSPSLCLSIKQRFAGKSCSDHLELGELVCHPHPFGNEIGIVYRVVLVPVDEVIDEITPIAVGRNDVGTSYDIVYLDDPISTFSRTHMVRGGAGLTGAFEKGMVGRTLTAMRTVFGTMFFRTGWTRPIVFDLAQICARWILITIIVMPSYVYISRGSADSK